VAHSMYFNKKYNRTGSLFQGTFKASQIKPNNLLYLSVYVNCNSEVHGIANAENYRWCSFPEYLGKRKEKLCHPEEILSDFGNSQEYFDFAIENLKEQIQRKADEKILLEEIS